LKVAGATKLGKKGLQKQGVQSKTAHPFAKDTKRKESDAWQVEKKKDHRTRKVWGRALSGLTGIFEKHGGTDGKKETKGHREKETGRKEWGGIKKHFRNNTQRRVGPPTGKKGDW